MTESSKAVFLSYASQDAEAAKRICEALRAAGVEVWFDQSELRGGDVWDRKIRQQIHDCALFIPIISANSQARPEGYFRLEWRLADQRTHLMGKNRAFLVPVCIDETRDADADIPDSFAAVQWTRLPAGNTPTAFVERVARLLSPDKVGPPAAHAAGAAADKVQTTSPSQAAMPEKSIAILPFANLSADKDNEYFSDGLAEEILNALSQVEDLRVASRGSAFSFKGKAVDTSEIASKLHVANVLEGSVRRAGNRIRVTVQLVDARNGFHLWSERYDRQMEDIFEIQDEIARAITERLKVTLGAGAERSTTNLAAYELYLKGRHYWHQRSPPAMRAAIQCFEQTIKLDPQYALAHAGLADCYGLLRFYGWMPAEAARAPAHAAMMQAMVLAPALWESHFSRGFYIFYFERNWREADPHFAKAIAIQPRSSMAHAYYSLFLTCAGHAEDALAHATLARELDPLSPIIHSLAASTLCTLGQFEAAERAAQHALELQPDYIFGLWIRALALCGLGRDAEAVDPLERASTLSRAPLFVGMLGFGYARAGRVEDAMRLLRELEDRAGRGEYVAATAPLTIWVGRGDIPGIRDALMKVVSEGGPPLPVRVTCGQFLEALRTDPEIRRLHRELFGW